MPGTRAMVAAMNRLALALALAVALIPACGGSKPAPAPAAPPAPPPSEPVAPAEPPAPPPPSAEVLAAAALAEQYDVGKQVYTDKKCASCHEDSGAGNAKNPAVIGEKALAAKAPAKAKLRKKVAFTTAKDVVDFVKAKMPLKEPGTLTDDEAHAVVAWLLDSNKIVLEAKLDATNAATLNLR